MDTSYYSEDSGIPMTLVLNSPVPKSEKSKREDLLDSQKDTWRSDLGIPDTARW